MEATGGGGGGGGEVLLRSNGLFSPSLEPLFCCSLTYWKILKSIVLSLSCSPISGASLQRSGRLQGVREEATGEARREVSLSLFRSSLRPGEEGGDSIGDSSGLLVGKRKSSEAILIGADFLLFDILRAREQLLGELRWPLLVFSPRSPFQEEEDRLADGEAQMPL